MLNYLLSHFSQIRIMTVDCSFCIELQWEIKFCHCNIVFVLTWIILGIIIANPFQLNYSATALLLSLGGKPFVKTLVFKENIYWKLHIFLVPIICYTKKYYKIQINTSKVDWIYSNRFTSKCIILVGYSLYIPCKVWELLPNLANKVWYLIEKG